MQAENTVPDNVQQFEFRAEIQQLLNILVHSLYTDREIFLRELVSNASDALNRLQFEMLTNPDVVDADAEPAIRITADAEAHTLTITDNGIGMNRDELIENLGTIAHSGAASFLKALQERGTKNSDIIGQFGVGFYSVFMVADEVRVVTRSFRKDDTAWAWTSRGDNAYTIEAVDKTTRGTEITLKLKEDAHDFAETWRLESIVKRHSNYVPFPIYVGDAEEPANARTAIWRRSRNEVTPDEYTEFYKQLSHDHNAPLLHIHQSVDSPVQYYTLLYIPSKADRGLWSADSLENGPKLYARKVLIQESAKELLPQWMRFLVGVVDSEDLPLNVSRETVRADQLMAALRKGIQSKVIAELESTAEKKPEDYRKFWEEFGRLIKEGAAMEFNPKEKEKLGRLLRFHTSRDPEGWVSLAEYKARMQEGQTEIYYLFGEDAKTIQRSPHLDIFRGRDLEVLFLTEPVDSVMMSSFPTFDGTNLKNGAEADLALPEQEQPDEAKGETLDQDQVAVLVRTMKDALGDKVGDVRESKLLTDSPVRLVTPEGGLGADMERLYKMMNQEFNAPKRILEINPRHAIIRGLPEMNEPLLRDLIVNQLYESALLLEGVHPNPAEMVPRIQALMEAATKK
jgi:HSP90 family molecular chaperone